MDNAPIPRCISPNERSDCAQGVAIINPIEYKGNKKKKKHS